MKNRAFEAAFENVRLSGDARERILDAASDGNAGAYRSGTRPAHRARLMKTVLAAAAAVCVLAGTALAVSPSLREMLWGDFGQVAQDFGETGENTQVYDGVEARLASAYTDGYIARAHIEFRDTEGDRLRALMETNDPDRSFFPIPVSPDLIVLGPEGTQGAQSMTGLAVEQFLKIVDFDEETGVATAELTMHQSNPPEGVNTIRVAIPSGAAGTESGGYEMIPVTVRFADGDSGGTGYFMSSVDSIGWTLTAPIEALPVREAENGTVRAFLSDIGLTLLGESGDGGTVCADTVTVRLADGTELTGEALASGEQIMGLDGERRMRIIDFTAPIHSADVVSVALDGVEMRFD